MVITRVNIGSNLSPLTALRKTLTCAGEGDDLTPRNPRDRRRFRDVRGDHLQPHGLLEGLAEGKVDVLDGTGGAASIKAIPI